MPEKDATIIMESLSSAMPHIAFPVELRELIERERVGCDCIETFVEKFRKKISEIHDVTRKTDGQIFLNELKRNIAKSSSD